jgi:hypothetical protein
MLNSVGYIDAGTGSYLLAAIASGAAGSWFFLRSQVAKLRGRGKSAASTDQAPEPTPTDS